MCNVHALALAAVIIVHVYILQLYYSCTACTTAVHGTTAVLQLYYSSCTTAVLHTAVHVLQLYY
jgi:hypothetical protein